MADDDIQDLLKTILKYAGIVPKDSVRLFQVVVTRKVEPDFHQIRTFGEFLQRIAAGLYIIDIPSARIAERQVEDLTVRIETKEEKGIVRIKNVTVRAGPEDIGHDFGEDWSEELEEASNRLSGQCKDSIDDFLWWIQKVVVAERE